MSQPASPRHEERWRELARQASQEKDPTKLLQLVQELIREKDRADRKPVARENPPHDS
jgi:hypothetical protein